MKQNGNAGCGLDKTTKKENAIIIILFMVPNRELGPPPCILVRYVFGLFSAFPVS